MLSFLFTHEKWKLKQIIIFPRSLWEFIANYIKLYYFAKYRAEHTLSYRDFYVVLSMLNLCFENIQLNFPHYFIRLKTNFHHNIVVIWLLVNCRERERGEFGIIFKICKRREGRWGREGGSGGRVLTATGEEEEEDSQSVQPPSSLLPQSPSNHPHWHQSWQQFCQWCWNCNHVKKCFSREFLRDPSLTESIQSEAAGFTFEIPLHWIVNLIFDIWYRNTLFVFL